MNYAQFRQNHYPIGSGVTEAACKTLIVIAQPRKIDKNSKADKVNP